MASKSRFVAKKKAYVRALKKAEKQVPSKSLQELEAEVRASMMLLLGTTVDIKSNTLRRGKEKLDEAIMGLKSTRESLNRIILSRDAQ